MLEKFHDFISFLGNLFLLLMKSFAFETTHRGGFHPIGSGQPSSNSHVLSNCETREEFEKVLRSPLENSWCGLNPVTFSPSRRICPWSGKKVPAIRLNRVVFPAPFGPINPVISPVWISKLIPFTARTPPKCLFRLRTEIT